MQRPWSLVALVLLGSQALAQEPRSASPFPFTTATMQHEGAGGREVLFTENGAMRAEDDRFTGNHAFPSFIGFMSNPLQSIDPRAVTAIYPLFGSAWVSNEAPIPNGDVQVYGPGMTLALSDRFALGMNQGGFADAHFSRNPRERQRLFARDPLGRFRNVELGGERDGWLNLGGFFQYTVIQDAAAQFLLTGGLRWEAPCGSHEMFQGFGPLHLAPYLTAGKEFGEFHGLATFGYQFPAGPGSTTTEAFYANVHLDRRLFGWLYPLVEFNASYLTKSASFGLQTRRGFIDFGNFESSGNIVTVATGANAVLIPERLEVGAVYSTSIATQKSFNVDGLLLKVMLRY
jgi:hypothetical protein